LRFDDGAETRRALEIEVKLGGRTGRVTVSPDRLFADVRSWAIEAVGSAATVYPVAKATEHVAVAIQQLSHELEGVEERTIYEHTGWTGSCDGRVYLHAGGAIGAQGSVAGVEVSLQGALSRFCLPEPPVGDELVAAVRSSLALLNVAPDRVTVPLLAAVARAPLGPVDLSVFLVGGTGNLKSELAARAQQHHGAEFDREHLPSNWQSTAGAIKETGFLAKDALLVIDDFKPQGDKRSVDQAHRVAEDVLRAQGNQAGRHRLDRSSNLRQERPPRGLMLVTGEDLPRVESIRARIVVVEVDRGDVDRDKLTGAQEAGKRGDYAASMAGYLRWLAEHSPDLAILREKVAADFDAGDVTGLHLRTPRALIELLLGIRCYLDYALDVGACTMEEASCIFDRARIAACQLAERQREHQTDENPARRFLRTLCAAIRQGDAYIADATTGNQPPHPESWGWKRSEYARQYEPRGRPVGWIEGSTVYVDRDPALAVVNDLAAKVESPIGLSTKALGKALVEAGCLERVEEGRGNVVRKTVPGGHRVECWAIRADAFSGPLRDLGAQSAQSAHWLASEDAR